MSILKMKHFGPTSMTKLTPSLNIWSDLLNAWQFAIL
jgi:hypothetical protein